MDKIQVEYVPVTDLVMCEQNPRKNDVQVEAMLKSMAAFGWTNPILARRENKMVIAGHTRLKAAIAQKIEKVPVIFLDLDEVNAKAYMLTDNKLTENVEWDYPKLADLFVELDQMNVDLELTGFTTDEIDEIAPATFGVDGLTDDDAIPEVKDIITKTGDLWLLGEHRLLCGDSTKADDVAKLMDGQQADMVFIDPPYAVNYGINQDDMNKKTGGKFRKVARPIKGDNLTTEQCAEQLWRPAFGNLYKSAKEDCSVYMTMCQGGDQMMMMMMMSEHWQVKHELIWVKSSPVFSMGRLDYDYQHEPILFGWKKKHNFYGKGEFLKSIWTIPKPNKSELHPTMKPIALMVNAMLNSSRMGDIVMDVFLGSGSTLIACEKLGRKCYGMEIDPYYCDIIIKRWEEFTGKKAEMAA